MLTGIGALVFSIKDQSHITFQQETVQGFEWTSCPDFNCKTPKTGTEKSFTLELDACLTNALNVIFGLSKIENYSTEYSSVSDLLVFAMY